MAPGTRRANRSGYVEHDDFEGLPVRQWRHEWVNISPPAQQEQQQQNDIWAVELIHGMPKDATLLPPHTQELLRAARSGRLYKRPPPNEDDEADGDPTMSDKLDKKDDDTSSQGYQIRVWKQLPKNVEAPGISHLAKRRKNVITVASRTVEDKVQGPTVTRATVRRMDAAGNPYMEEVTLAEGQHVEGEVIATRVEAIAAPQPNTYAAASSSAARRRPPPPKRKAKAGPGRGKKKMKQPHFVQQRLARAMPAAGARVAAPVKTEVKEQLTPTPNKSEAPNPDSEMGDVDGDDDEEEEGDDGDEGEDGDEGDETELQDESALDVTKDHDKEMVDASHILDRPDFEMKDELPTPSEPVPRAPSPPQPSSIPALEVPSERTTGSPLKQEDTPPRNLIVVPSPSEPSVLTESAVEAAQPVLDTLADNNTTDSTIAEPPSTIVGVAPKEAIERDMPQAGELPPPEQVGNISSPKAEDETSRISEGAHKGQTSSQPDINIQKPVLLHQLSTMTEDTIKPEDSISVTAPLPGSEAPSEVGNASIDDAREEIAPANAVAETTEAEMTALEADVDADMAKDDEPDLLDGLMGELDRQAAAAQLLQESMTDIAAATEGKPEGPVEPALPDVLEPAAPEAAPPVVEEAPEPAPEPELESELESKPELELKTKPEPEPELEAEPNSESLPVPAQGEQPVAESTPPVKLEPSAAEEEKEDPPANA